MKGREVAKHPGEPQYQPTNPLAPTSSESKPTFEQIKRQLPLSVIPTHDGNFELNIGKDPLDFFIKLGETAGSYAPSLSLGLVNQALKTSAPGQASQDELDRTLAALHELKPKNALEGMITVQMVSMHNLAMSFMARAFRADQTIDGIDKNVERANKCLRTFVTLTETLNRLRGNGQQKVVVEHVTVNQDGQAVVGSIIHREGGGAGG